MYARHIPVAVFSLALVIDGIPNVGVVYESLQIVYIRPLREKELIKIMKKYIIEE